MALVPDRVIRYVGKVNVVRWTLGAALAANLAISAFVTIVGDPGRNPCCAGTSRTLPFIAPIGLIAYSITLVWCLLRGPKKELLYGLSFLLASHAFLVGSLIQERLACILCFLPAAICLVAFAACVAAAPRVGQRAALVGSALLIPVVLAAPSVMAYYRLDRTIRNLDGSHFVGNGTIKVLVVERDTCRAPETFRKSLLPLLEREFSRWIRVRSVDAASCSNPDRGVVVGTSRWEAEVIRDWSNYSGIRSAILKRLAEASNVSRAGF